MRYANSLARRYSRAASINLVVYPPSLFQGEMKQYPRKVEIVEPCFNTTNPSGYPHRNEAPNFYAASCGSSKYGHMTTYELLAGAGNVTPIKFSQLTTGSTGKSAYLELTCKVLLLYQNIIGPKLAIDCISISVNYFKTFFRSLPSENR